MVVRGSGWEVGVRVCCVGVRVGSRDHLVPSFVVSMPKA